MGVDRSRRRFLSAAAAAAATIATSAHRRAFAAPQSAERGRERGTMPTRRLGRTNVNVSLLGIGGYHLGVPSEREGIRIIHDAIDHGVTFLDNCWDYHSGESERRMGKALADGHRKQVFLMTKIDGRTRDVAAQQIEQSLKRLRTDVIDLVQLHEVIYPEDPKRTFAPKGAIEALVAARAAGKIRFIGFTGHKDPAIHLAMLREALSHGFTFDTVQMPLNVMDPHFRSFEKNVLPVLLQHDIGVLGMKPMGGGDVLSSGVVAPIECLHYAMSLPTSVVINGCDSLERLDQALRAAYTFTPMSEGEVRDVLARTAGAAAEGRFEPFKTSDKYDGTRHNPKWLTSASP